MKRTLAVGLLLCACAAPPAKPSAPARPSVPTAAKTEATARQRLLVALEKLDAAPPVLEALDGQTRAELAAVVSGLTEQERAALADARGPLAGERPLLHLAAGGNSDQALLALSTGPRGADDLVFARRAGKRDRVDDLPALQRELVRRGATTWLADQSELLAGPERVPPAYFDAVDRAALALDRLDLQRLARDAAVELDPSASNWLAASRARACELDVEGARAAFGRARNAAGAAEAAEELAETTALIEAAERASAAPPDPNDAAAVVLRARALMQLRRYADALRLLEPQRDRARAHLGLATALANATTHGATCPGLPPIAGNGLLCALAWRNDPASVAAAAIVRAAWESSKGRDSAALEGYVGLIHVLPWLYSVIADGLEPTSPLFVERLRALETATQQISALDAEFAGLSLFVDALAAGVELAATRKPGTPARIPEATQQSLEARARELSSRAPRGRFAESGVLAVAALLAQDRDVLPLLDALPEQGAPPHRLPRAELVLWAAVARGRPEAAERARSAIASLLPRQDAVSRSELVLLMAEAGQALERSDKSSQVLAQVSRQLGRADAPESLRARAMIDLAGTTAQSGKHSDAVELLESAFPAATLQPNESELARFARGYALALRASAAQGPEREAQKKKLAQHVEQTPSSVPASLQSWQELWRLDLERPTPKRRAAAAARLFERVGAETARLLGRGTLASGTVKLSFHFSAENGLVPLIGFEPMLLVAGLGR